MLVLTAVHNMLGECRSRRAVIVRVLNWAFTDFFSARTVDGIDT